nr:acylphosphatase [Candidatus Njordarchaeota archaeon]
MKVRAHVLIEGDVQGVGFRASAWSVAQKLEVTGWVRNVVDGRVETLIEGEKDRVEKMVQWCSRGPPGSYVANLKVEWLPYKGEFKTFEIERTASNW